MRPVEPLPLNHSWPLSAVDERVPGLMAQMESMAAGDALAMQGIGLWHCDLATERLTWTAGVYDIFGLARDEEVSRAHTVSLYAPDSRAAMERLRAHAIRHRRGFTIDVDIDPIGSMRRAMRLTAVPVIGPHGVIELRGMKRRLRSVSGHGERQDATLLATP